MSRNGNYLFARVLVLPNIILVNPFIISKTITVALHIIEFHNTAYIDHSHTSEYKDSHPFTAQNKQDKNNSAERDDNNPGNQHTHHIYYNDIQWRPLAQTSEPILHSLGEIKTPFHSIFNLSNHLHSIFRPPIINIS